MILERGGQRYDDTQHVTASWVVSTIRRISQLRFKAAARLQKRDAGERPPLVRTRGIALQSVRDHVSIGASHICTYLSLGGGISAVIDRCTETYLLLHMPI